MKIKLAAIALLGFLLSLSPALATPISKTTANQYYQNCKEQRDPQFSTQVQDMFCACTAAQLVSSFTMEDMQSISRQDQIGRNATNKMIVEVYSPCIKYPAKQYHYNSCISNPQTKILGNPQALCECSAERVAAHLQNDAKSMFRNLLSRNPNITDPMQALYNDRQFQKFAQQQIMGCVRR